MNQNNEIILYSTPDGNKKVGVLFHDENFWLTQKALAELFNVKIPAVSKHLKNIFESGELIEDSVVSILETTAADGKTIKPTITTSMPFKSLFGKSQRPTTNSA